MRISPMEPTTHTPPDGSSRSPMRRTGKQLVNTLGLRTQRIRLACREIDQITPGMLEGHAGRLDNAVHEAAQHFERGLEVLKNELAVLGKWDRARGVARRDIVDSAELRSIEDGGNG